MITLNDIKVSHCRPLLSACYCDPLHICLVPEKAFVLLPGFS